MRHVIRVLGAIWSIWFALTLGLLQAEDSPVNGDRSNVVAISFDLADLHGHVHPLSQNDLRAVRVFRSSPPRCRTDIRKSMSVR